MEENKSLGKYIGQGMIIVLLYLIMLVVKLVQPFSVVLQTLPDVWLNFIAQFIYAGIEFILITVICCHFIFCWSFEALGIKKFKENIRVFILNLFFLAGCIVVTYFVSQMSRTLEFNGLAVALSIIGNFVCSAFVSEVIFRGYLLANFEKLFRKKGLVSGVIGSLVVGILYACTYIPEVLIHIDSFSMQAMLQALLVPFGVGVYLCLIYHLTDNLWTCVAISGVWLSLASLSADFFNMVFSGMYIGFMVIYLFWSMISYYRKDEEEQVQDGNLGDSYCFENFDIEQEKQVELNQEEQEEVQEAMPLREGKAEEASGLKEEPKADIEPLNEKVDIPFFETNVEEIEEKKADAEALEKTMIMPVITDEMEKTAVIPAVAEELENTTVIPAVVEELENTTVIPAVAEELENTTVIPAVVEELENTTVIPAAAEEIEDTIVIPAVTNELEETKVMPTVDLEQDEVKNSQSKGAKVIPFSSRSKQSEKMERMTSSPIKQQVDKGNPKLRVKAEPNYIAHLEKYLGDFEGIFRQMTPTDPPIDIMFFKGKYYNALVTNGMRSMPIKLPPELGDYQMLELMMFLDKSIEINDDNIEDEENAWLIRLLIDLALFPKETGSYLGVGHIVGNGEALEPYYPGNDYCGALIFPPMEQENVKFYRYVEKGNTIYIHNVMPLFKDELRFIQEHSADQFINLMSELGVRQIIKRQRINVIQAMNEDKK